MIKKSFIAALLITGHTYAETAIDTHTSTPNQAKTVFAQALESVIKECKTKVDNLTQASKTLPSRLSPSALLNIIKRDPYFLTQSKFKKTLTEIEDYNRKQQDVVMKKIAGITVVDAKTRKDVIDEIDAKKSICEVSVQTTLDQINKQKKEKL
ncbi:MAG: hypothetical protein ACK5VW_03745 [Holosporales bacterium]